MTHASGGLATYCCPCGPHRRATVAGLRLVGGTVRSSQDADLLISLPQPVSTVALRLLCRGELFLFLLWRLLWGRLGAGYRESRRGLAKFAAAKSTRGLATMTFSIGESAGHTGPCLEKG